ncbi:MAG TPA: nuclear transport factor 2 family protein [Gemmatimonadaceae bacterium]
MNPTSIAVLLAVFVATPAVGQSSKGAAPAPAPTPRQVSRPTPAILPPIKLEDQWTTALVKRDAATFERLLARNFVYTEDASVMSRGDVIKSVTGTDRVEWARNEGMKVHDFGDVHVITGVLHLRGRGKGGAFDRRYQFTDTWQRRNGRWQIIAAQDYLIPK